MEVLKDTVLPWEASKKVEAVSQHYVLMMYKTTKKLGIIDITEARYDYIILEKHNQEQRANAMVEIC